MGKSNKDNRDKYYRMAKQQGWRARSAFKLLYLDEYYSIFKDVKRVVDLCAAPGSWSQVLSRNLYQKSKDENGVSDVKIVAVDLQPMLPLEGVTQIQGDITSIDTAKEIISHFEGLSADLVVCDGSPDVTGIHSLDIYMQGELLLGAIYIAANVLRQGGTFVAKIFVGDDTDMFLLKSKLRALFREIYIIKPPSSRKSSIESYALCRIHRTHPEFDPTLLAPYLNPKYHDFSHLTGINRKLIAFIARGDLNGFSDSDFKYPGDGDKVIQYKKKETISTETIDNSSLECDQNNKIDDSKENILVKDLPSCEENISVEVSVTESLASCNLNEQENNENISSIKKHDDFNKNESI